jgi:prolyl 4-hydroxylase
MLTTSFLIICLIGVLLVYSWYICDLLDQHHTPQSSLGYTSIDADYTRPVIYNKFITPAQCDAIKDYARDKLFESEIVGGKHHDIRNSMQCWISKNHKLAKPLFERIAKEFNLTFDQAEDLQVVRYLPNQYYNEHHDSCCDDNDQCKEFIKRGGQRVLTVLIYLNNEFEGGHTYFKNLDLKLKPSTGSAAVFFPLANNSNKCHPLALHAGTPVSSGEKWIANLWFREGKFT